MKNRNLLVGCLLFPVLVILAFYLGYLGTGQFHNQASFTQNDNWLLITPAGDIPDYNEITNDLVPGGNSVEEICRKIKSASTDKKITGIILKPRSIQVSSPGLNEIGNALATFRKTHKPIFAYLDMQNQKDYLLASYADQIIMEPAASAGFFLPGVEANVTFYKNLLDKLGLKINIVKSGQFKGYGEAYSQTALSPGTYENIKSVLADRYSLLLSDVASHRKLSAEQVKVIFESRPDYLISPQYAKAVKLVDGLDSYDAFLKNHGISRKQLLNLSDYVTADQNLPGINKIAVIYLQGDIVSDPSGQMGYSIDNNKLRTITDQIKKDSRIKAIVLRINSPGGSALESERIHRSLLELKSSYPLVVSMSGTAASGGYYISSAGDYIVADPYTVTGSIGVIQLVPDASGLSRKIGINGQTIGFGKYAGAYNLMNAPGSELLASLQRNSDSVYREFKQRVASGRKLDFNTLDNIAEGRVWSAQAALRYKLIDEIGSLDVALKKAADLAKLPSFQVAVYPNPKSIWSVYLDRLYNNSNTLLKTTQTVSLDNLLEKQLTAIFQPYQSLCLMPYDFDR